MSESAVLEPGCVLDATNGPIVVADRAIIGANAVLKGPCWVGAGSVVAPLTQVRAGTSLGPMCKVGGEVSATIILGYSSKGHEGFLGDSYLGEWVNLGSGTTTSNLKNTYGEVTARRGPREVKTGRQFLGALIGDHAKTAILTRLMAGTYIGYGSSVATTGIAPRFVPSFTFLTDRGPEPYDMGRAAEVARRVFARRKRDFGPEDQRLMEAAAEEAIRVEAT